MKVLLLVGPTGVGKTELALELAQALGGEIVGADSRQLYRGLEIGTAKPTAAQRAQVPHHLLDVADPDEELTLASYLEQARAAIADIARRGQLPLVIGGTGLYIWALLGGVKVPMVPPDPEARGALEERARREGPWALHAELARLDPASAARIEPRNARRLIRALEIVAATGQPVPPFSEGPGRPYEALVCGLTMPRPALHRRTEARIEAMLAAGWLEEVRGLLARGYDALHPAFAALGYRDLIAHLRGELDWATAVERIKLATRRFIRRQYTWFRRPELGVRWFDVGAPDQVGALRLLVSSFLRVPEAAAV